MTLKRRIGLLGFGEVGQILGQDIHAEMIYAYDTKFSRSRDEFAGNTRSNDRVHLCQNPAELCENSEIIVCAVTAEQTEEAAKSVAASMKSKSWFLDLNSAAPSTKLRAAKLINNAGGRYVEAAVMSPVPPKRLDSPILLAGPYAQSFCEIASRIGFSNLTSYSTSYGKASAAKMSRSILIKGVEALLTESLIVAKLQGVETTVLESLDDLFPGPIWAELSQYMISRSLEHGGRRAEEMREVAKMVAELGLEPSMTLATVDRQEWAKTHCDLIKTDTLDALLDALGERVRSNVEGHPA